MNLRTAWIALLVVGLLLMVPFDHPVSRILGVLSLLSFAAIGLFLIVTPDYVAEDDGSEPTARSARPAQSDTTCRRRR